MEIVYDGEEGKVERYTIQEIAKVFPMLYSEVFGSYGFQGNYPSEVYVGYVDGNYVGFLSGYVHSPNTWYLQRAGFTKDQQSKIENRRLAEVAMIEILHKKWKYILTLISNEDIRALKFALSIGFKIIGIRMDTAQKIWVEFIREGNNNGIEKTHIG